MEASLKDLGYPGFDVTRFLSPNLAWLRLGITTYGVGLALISQSSDQNGSSGSAFTSNPLTNVVFQGGIYLGPDDQLFRFYSGFGCFLRVLHAPGLPLQLEPISWGGFQVTVGTEIGRTPTGRFFFEYTPMFYVVSMPSLFQASLGTGNTPPGMGLRIRLGDKPAFLPRRLQVAAMKRLCALALLVLAALSCSPPPFNLGITQTALTAEHMTLLGQVGPIQNIGSNQGNATLIFYPEKDPVAGITLQAGFVSWAQGSSQQVAFVGIGPRRRGLAEPWSE